MTMPTVDRPQENAPKGFWEQEAGPGFKMIVFGLLSALGILLGVLLGLGMT